MGKDIYEEIVRLRSEGSRAVLAVIIARKGATPRKDSAKLKRKSVMKRKKHWRQVSRV